MCPINLRSREHVCNLKEGCDNGKDEIDCAGNIDLEHITVTEKSAEPAIYFLKLTSIKLKTNIEEKTDIVAFGLPVRTILRKKTALDRK
ncbi:DgyrCDS14406 [Dimorphilus gyrociliatus]|uniref:DgyrCDS14406 n=1 Tax=Dimorphilus gyrociliatus TaxID=2664684 RepID=A0A7I8WDT2_9ANNE|nr:DgyrCDS14406 [Dimorphilus gyrociliatus]